MRPGTLQCDLWKRERALEPSDRKPQKRLGEYDGDRDEEHFWREIRPQREPIGRRWFLPAVLLLLALSIPWYSVGSWYERSLAGLPLWLWTALACSAGVALLTACAVLMLWDDDAVEPGGGAEERRPADDAAASGKS